MRCDECKTEPLTPGHYCECCGRKLSLQERKALDEEKANETSWGEPAPVRAAAPAGQSGDRLIGVHFAPVPELYADPVVEVSAPQVDPDLDAHFDAHFATAALATPVVPVSAPVIDPILEAHFAGLAPVEASPVHVTAPLSIEAVSVAQAAVPTPVDEPTADGPAVHLDSGAPAARCESCGGPADEADLCSPCQQAFHSLLDSSVPAPLPDAIAAPAVAVAPAVGVAREAAVAVTEPPAAPAVQVAAVAAVVTAPTPPAAPVKSVIQIKKPAPVVVAPVEAAAPPQPRAPRPPTVPAAVMPPAQPGRARTIAAGAAVIVVVAAIGFPLGKLWLGGQETSAIVLEEQPTPAVTPEAAAPEVEVTPLSVPEPVATTARAESAVQATPKTTKATPVAPVRPKATASAPPRASTARVPSKTVRQPVTPARPTAATAVSSPVAVAPAPEVAPAPVAVPEPKPEPPAAPVGPFFELRDVNETPRVATRVEPQVPDDLRDRQLNEVVVVRVLVTQAGHPLMVNLLRKSRSGLSLDNAIIAAVKQWTFVPARKRGEAVSCWYHVGVPVIRAN